MKKILVFVVVVFIGLLKVQGLQIVVQSNSEDSEVIDYSRPILNGKKSFYLGYNDKSYQINNMETWYLNNLAYLGNSYTDEIYPAVIQIMIWENLYSDLNFQILVDGNAIDLKPYVDEIIKKIYSYKLISEYDNKIIRQNNGSTAELSGFTNIEGYTTTSTKAKVNRWSVIFYKSSITGPVSATFFYKLDVKSNIINATKVVTKPFTVTSIVDNPTYKVEFKNQAFINKDTISKDFDKINVTVKNLDIPGKIYTIYYDMRLYTVAGRYYYIDNITKEEGYFTVTKEMDFVLKHYLISGFKLDQEITSLIIDGKNYQVTYKDGINYLDEPVVAGVHNIIINGSKFDVNLYDNSLLSFEDDLIFYKWNEEIPEKPVEQDKPIEPDIPVKPDETQESDKPTEPDIPVEPDVPQESDKLIEPIIKPVETVPDDNKSNVDTKIDEIKPVVDGDDEGKKDEVIIAVPNTETKKVEQVLSYVKKKYYYIFTT